MNQLPELLYRQKLKYYFLSLRKLHTPEFRKYACQTHRNWKKGFISYSHGLQTIVHS